MSLNHNVLHIVLVLIQKLGAQLSTATQESEPYFWEIEILRYLNTLHFLLKETSRPAPVSQLISNIQSVVDHLPEEFRERWELEDFLKNHKKQTA